MRLSCSGSMHDLSYKLIVALEVQADGNGFSQFKLFQSKLKLNFQTEETLVSADETLVPSSRNILFQRLKI